MKSIRSTLRMAFTALAFMIGTGEPLVRFSLAATGVQHKRPTPTPTPASPGIIPPGNPGGAPRSTGAAARDDGKRAIPAPSPDPHRIIILGDRGGFLRSQPASNANRSNQNQGIRQSNRQFGGGGFGGAGSRSNRARRSPAAQSLDDFEAFGSEFRRAEFRRPCDPAEQPKNELSGVYFGYVDFEALDLRGEAGLRICGNTFTLFKGERTASGVVTTVTTSGYTAAALRFTRDTGFAVPLLSLPKTVSVVVNRQGETTSFRSTREEHTKFAFSGPKFRFHAPRP